MTSPLLEWTKCATVESWIKIVFLKIKVLVFMNLNNNLYVDYRYVWRLVCCASCGTHLGWEFSSNTFNPRLFYGVRRAAFQWDWEPLPRRSSDPPPKKPDEMDEPDNYEQKHRLLLSARSWWIIISILSPYKKRANGSIKRSTGGIWRGKGKKE